MQTPKRSPDEERRLVEPIPQAELERLREVQKHLTSEEKKEVRKSLSDVKKTAEAGIAAIESIEAKGRARQAAEIKKAAGKTDPKPRKPRQSAGRGGARAAREVAEIDAEAEVKDTEEIVRDINEIIGPEGAPELNPNDPENRARIGVAKSAEKSKDHN